MKISSMHFLRCPDCHQFLDLTVQRWKLAPSGDCQEIFEGTLVCQCGRNFPVKKGIPWFACQEKDRGGEFRFSAVRLRRLSRIERKHFWFVGRRVLLERLMGKYLSQKPATVLDLGCGTGAMAECLSRQGHRVIASDLRPEGLLASRRTDPDSFWIQTDASRLPLGEGLFDAVFMMDVLEHVDDEKVLAEVKRVLRPGGGLFISVPAWPWLWSFRDVLAGHQRRYSPRNLLALLGRAGFAVHEIRFYQCLLFPLVLAARLIARGRPQLCDLEDRPWPPLNGLFAWINLVEVKIGRFIPWPFGSSMLVFCRGKQ